MHCWRQCKLAHPQWKTVELSYDAAILLLSIYTKKTKTVIRKDICTPRFIVALFTIIHYWILFSHKKGWNLAIGTTWMDLVGYTQCKVRHIKINTVWFHLHVENKREWKWATMTKQTDSQIQRTNRLLTGDQSGERRVKGEGD